MVDPVSAALLCIHIWEICRRYFTIHSQKGTICGLAEPAYAHVQDFSLVGWDDIATYPIDSFNPVTFSQESFTCLLPYILLLSASNSGILGNVKVGSSLFAFGGPSVTQLLETTETD